MTPRTRQGLVLLAVALTLGVVADALARLVPGRLDVVLGLGALVLAIVALAQTGAVTLPGSLAPLGVPLALLGLALLWRDSPTLFALNLAGVASVAVLASPRLRSVGRRRAGLSDYAIGAGRARRRGRRRRTRARPHRHRLGHRAGRCPGTPGSGAPRSVMAAACPWRRSSAGCSCMPTLPSTAW